MDLFRKIQTLISSVLHISPGSVTPDTDISIDLGADDNDRMEITMAIEDEFGIDIPDDTAATLNTPQDIQNHLEAITA